MLGAYACECPTTSRPLVRDNVQRLEMGIALPVGEDGGDWCADARLRPAAWEQPHRARAEEYVRRRLERGGEKRVGRALGVESGRKDGQMPMPLPPRIGSAGRRRAPAHPDLAPSAVLARYRPRSAVQQCRRNDRGARQSAANWSPFRRGCLELTQVIFMSGMSIRRGTQMSPGGRTTQRIYNLKQESGRRRSSGPPPLGVCFLSFPLGWGCVLNSKCSKISRPVQLPPSTRAARRANTPHTSRKSLCEVETHPLLAQCPSLSVAVIGARYPAQAHP